MSYLSILLPFMPGLHRLSKCQFMPGLHCLFNSLAVNARTVSYLSVSLPKSVYVRAASHILSVSLRQGCIAYPRVWLLMPGLCLQSKCLTVYARAASPIQVSVYVRAASPIQVSVYARAASPFQVSGC